MNVEGVGAVMASPDDDPDYYYHWMRDGALSIKVRNLDFVISSIVISNI